MAKRSMAEKQATRGASRSAVAVRVLAFVGATLGILAIPAALFATTVWHLPLQAALMAVGGAAALILAATYAARRVDPLRG